MSWGCPAVLGTRHQKHWTVCARGFPLKHACCLRIGTLGGRGRQGALTAITVKHSLDTLLMKANCVSCWRGSGANRCNLQTHCLHSTMGMYRHTPCQQQVPANGLALSASHSRAGGPGDFGTAASKLPISLPALGLPAHLLLSSAVLLRKTAGSPLPCRTRALSESDRAHGLTSCQT